MHNEMDSLIQQRQRKVQKKQKNQTPYAYGILVVAVMISIFLWINNHSYTALWTIGIGIGIVLRASRFCFSGAIREPFILGNTKLLRGLLLAMMVSTVGFGVIQYNYLKSNPIVYSNIPGSITSVGLHVIIGAFLFGVGMIIAGGCASGALMRIGEGHALQWIVLLGFLIGNVLGAKNYPVWNDKIISKSKIIYFPEYLDLRIVVILQLVVLMIFYKIASWYENKRLRAKMTEE